MKGAIMVDVPTPAETIEEINQGNPPTSLGDVARAGDDPILAQDQDTAPDPELHPEES